MRCPRTETGVKYPLRKVTRHPAKQAAYSAPRRSAVPGRPQDLACAGLPDRLKIRPPPLQSFRFTPPKQGESHPREQPGQEALENHDAKACPPADPAIHDAAGWHWRLACPRLPEEAARGIRRYAKKRPFASESRRRPGPDRGSGRL